VTLIILYCALESKCRNHVIIKMKVHVFGGGDEKHKGLNGWLIASNIENYY
jgi:hypothetical protein